MVVFYKNVKKVVAEKQKIPVKTCFPLATFGCETKKTTMSSGFSQKILA